MAANIFPEPVSGAGGPRADRFVIQKTQKIARGPVAALVAIKQAGTNGGGYFGPNSTHPFENPNPWANLLAIAAIVVLPMASLVMAGRMLKNRAHAAVIYGVMLTLPRPRP